MQSLHVEGQVVVGLGWRPYKPSSLKHLGRSLKPIHLVVRVGHSVVLVLHTNRKRVSGGVDVVGEGVE